MKKIIRSTFIIFLCLIIILPMFISASTTNQIDYVGGETVSSDDMVKISKTIEHKEGDLENYFDITLKVETKSTAEEILKSQDLAIVIVMDISNTMKTYGIDGVKESTGTRRIEAAQEAAKSFIDSFTESAKNSDGAVRELGFVAFNTDSHEIFGLKKYTESNSSTYASDLKNEMITETNSIINSKYTNFFDKQNNIKNNKIPNSVDYGSSYTRFTNMEAGLRMGRNLINSSQSKNKYIIFISDGFPTTYSNLTSDSNGYSGYNVYMKNINKYYQNSSTKNASTEGIFYNENTNELCTKGVSYSDEAARRAASVANTIKNEGTKIFSIGIGLTKQKLEDLYTSYIDVDKDKYEAKGGYEIGVNSDDFKQWLGNVIGSGYSTNPNESYYSDPNNLDTLKSAYAKIFERIKNLASESAEVTWVVEDPMNSVSSENNFIEFVGLYDDKNDLKDSLTNGNNDESDTASYSNDTLKWDLKKSTYTGPSRTTINDKEVDVYTYEVKYRIRLKNESPGFITENKYETNGETKLTYVVRKGTGEVSELKTLIFKNPKVHGYLGQLKLTKINKFDQSTVSGAKFILVHDLNCSCHKEEKSATIDDMEVVSDTIGNIIFENIPSGHKYLLSEVSTLDNLIKDDKTYSVSVDYGEVKIEGLVNNEFINDYQTGSLEIEKNVSGTGNKDGKFTFIITATYNNQLIKNKTFKYTGSRTGEITFNDEGKITFELANNEKIIINNLPIGAVYEIEEINTDGYVVKTEINENITIGNKVNITQGDINKVKFINITSYELPATGSSKMLILIIIGSLLLGLPIIYIGYMFYKRKIS